MSHGSHSSGHAGGHGVGHIVPVGLQFGILMLLLVLTYITVAARWIDLGPLNIWIAMLIATVKAAFVVLYFMHLRYDRPFNSIIFIGSLLFVALFVCLALADTVVNKPKMWGGLAPAVAETQKHSSP